MDKVWIVVGLVMSLAWTCGGVWLAFAEILRSKHAKAWPSVTGHVLDSQVKVGGDDATVYHVEVEYQYSIAGHLYKGSESIFTPWGISEKKERINAEGVCHSYPVGLELKIAYNPKRPEQSVIAVDVRRRVNNVMILSGFIMLITGLFLLFQGLSLW